MWPKTIVYVVATAGRNDRATGVVRFVVKCRCFRNTWKFAELTYTLGNSKNERTETNFQTTGPWLPTESMNDFHSLNFEHIFDQLDATIFNGKT